jgi:DhnA family fructose-bisphosphate aldolase class Ia
MSLTGLEHRMKRIIRQDTGRSLVVAVDHGYALGPMTGIVDIAGTISKLDATGQVDAWLLTKGIFRHAFNPAGNPGVILRSSGGATIAGPDLSNEGLVTSVEEGLTLGADAMAVSAFIGSENERETLIGLSRTADDCHRWNVPLLGVIGLGKALGDKKNDAKYLALSARVAAEHGADLIKTYYTEKGFEDVVAGCPVPIMIAGGPKCETDLDTLKMIHRALQSGARGIVMGRNIWKSRHPAALLNAVWHLIHKSCSVQEAQDILCHLIHKDCSEQKAQGISEESKEI